LEPILKKAGALSTNTSTITAGSASSIKNQNIGVTASVIQDSNSYRLALETADRPNTRLAILLNDARSSEKVISALKRFKEFANR
jgi:hypothetical protein